MSLTKAACSASPAAASSDPTNPGNTIPLGRVGPRAAATLDTRAVMARKSQTDYDSSPHLEDAPLTASELDVMLQDRSVRPAGRQELVHFCMRVKATIDVAGQTRRNLERTISSLQQEMQAAQAARDNAAVSYVLSTMSTSAIVELIDARAGQTLQEAIDAKAAADKNLMETEKAAGAVQAAAGRLIEDPDIPMYVKERLRAHLAALLREA